MVPRGSFSLCWIPVTSFLASDFSQSQQAIEPGKTIVDEYVFENSSFNRTNRTSWWYVYIYIYILLYIHTYSYIHTWLNHFMKLTNHVDAWCILTLWGIHLDRLRSLVASLALHRALFVQCLSWQSKWRGDTNGLTQWRMVPDTSPFTGCFTIAPASHS